MAKTLKVVPTKQDLFDIFTEAVENGINYWAVVEKYHWRNSDGSNDLEGFHATVRETEPNGPSKTHEITSAVIVKGLQSLLAGSVTSGGRAWDRKRQIQIASGLLAGTGDALDADVVIQAALFGDVIYG